MKTIIFIESNCRMNGIKFYDFVVFFFNHFGKWKITEDPTPMEVEMRAYEEQVDQTILEMENRKENNSG